MMEKLDCSVDDSEGNPTTSSEDPDVRKAARALRVAKREETVRKLEAAVDASNGFDTFDNDEPVGLVEKQVAECAAIIEHLLADGEERVTNIRVANDAREIARRFKEAHNKKELLAKLEDEANLAQEKFEKISSQWSVILELSYPLDIEHEMNLQKERCRDLIVQKETITKDLKEELKQSDETFYTDLHKQLNDIKQLGERIDAQVTLMKNAYRTQLELIENSIEIERKSILEKNEKRWSNLYEQRNSNEINNISKKINQISEFKDKIDSMTVEHREKYRETKIQLENEIQTLHRELQELKTTCLINSEKIDYTYHILKRREEENISVKVQQKRRLNKMQDVINELKKKISMTHKNNATEKTKTNREIERVEKSISELQSKADYFVMVNEKKYQQVWKMNRLKCVNLINEINGMDKIINEEILGIDWTEPQLSLLKVTDLPSYKSAMLNVGNANVKVINSDLDGSEASSSRETPCDKSQMKLINHILTLIADTSGFLLEEKLWNILNSYEEIPNNICKIDNIFNALDIKSDEDINILLKHFMKYCYCERCKGPQAMQSTSPDQISEDSEQKCHCKCGMKFNIKSSHVLFVLRDFVNKYKTKEESKLDEVAVNEAATKSIAMFRHLSNKDVTLYWTRYRDVFSPQHEKLWDHLIVGLTKYLQILQDRHRLNGEVTQLRKQNSELKNLLKGHIPSGEVPKQKYLTPISKKFTFK